MLKTLLFLVCIVSASTFAQDQGVQERDVVEIQLSHDLLNSSPTFESLESVQAQWGDFRYRWTFSDESARKSFWLALADTDRQTIEARLLQIFELQGAEILSAKTKSSLTVFELARELNLSKAVSAMEELIQNNPASYPESVRDKVYFSALSYELDQMNSASQIDVKKYLELFKKIKKHTVRGSKADTKLLAYAAQTLFLQILRSDAIAPEDRRLELLQNLVSFSKDPSKALDQMIYESSLRYYFLASAVLLRESTEEGINREWIEAFATAIPSSSESRLAFLNALVVLKKQSSSVAASSLLVEWLKFGSSEFSSNESVKHVAWSTEIICSYLEVLPHLLETQGDSLFIQPQLEEKLVLGLRSSILEDKVYAVSVLAAYGSAAQTPSVRTALLDNMLLTSDMSLSFAKIFPGESLMLLGKMLQGADLPENQTEWLKIALKQAEDLIAAPSRQPAAPNENASLQTLLRHRAVNSVVSARALKAERLREAYEAQSK